MEVKIIGKVKGTFNDKETGKAIKYCNLFVSFPMAYTDPQTQFDGEKVDKYKCTDEIFGEIIVGCSYEIFFDDKQKVSFVRGVNEPF